MCTAKHCFSKHCKCTSLYHSHRDQHIIKQECIFQTSIWILCDNKNAWKLRMIFLKKLKTVLVDGNIVTDLLSVSIWSHSRLNSPTFSVCSNRFLEKKIPVTTIWTYFWKQQWELKKQPSQRSIYFCNVCF